MANLSAVLGIKDSAGLRVDRSLAVAGGFLPTWLKLGTGLTATAAKNGQSEVWVTIAVDGDAAGSVPTTRTISVFAPLLVNDGYTATLASNISLSIDAADASNPGTMSAAHYTLVQNATASATASRIVLRDASADTAVRRLTAERIIGSGPGLDLYGDGTGAAQDVRVRGQDVDVEVGVSFFVKVTGGLNAIEVTSASTYVSGATVEIDTPEIRTPAYVQMLKQPAPAAHATEGRLYYSDSDGKLHFVQSVADGSADVALW